MNSSLRHHPWLPLVAYVVVGLAVTNCQSSADSKVETPPGDGTIVAAGTTTRPLDSLTFISPPGDGFDDGPESVYGVCNLTFDAESVAIIEVAAGYRAVPQTPECNGPYSTDVLLAHATVLGVVAGKDLPRELELVFFAQNAFSVLPPDSTILLLVNLRTVGSETFVVNFVRAQEGPDVAPQLPGRHAADLPDTFEALSMAAMDTFAHYAERCPDLYRNQRTDEAWAEFCYDASSWGCVPRDEQPHEDADAN